MDLHQNQCTVSTVYDATLEAIEAQNTEQSSAKDLKYHDLHEISNLNLVGLERKPEFMFWGRHRKIMRLAQK